MSRYDVEKFETPPDPNLLCCICKCVMEGAVESPCRHAFCRTCINTWMNTRHNCPTCRKHLNQRDLILILPIVQNIINRLVMFCDFRDKGCEEKICLENYVSHIESCKYGPAKCTHCHQMFRKHELKEHEKTCQFCLIQCQKGCDQMVAMKHLPQHDCCQHLKSTIVGLKSKITDLENKIEEARERLERNNHHSDSDYFYDSEAENSDVSYGSHTPYRIDEENSFEWTTLPESSVSNRMPNVVAPNNQSTARTQTTNSQSASCPVTITITEITRTSQSNPHVTTNQMSTNPASARIQPTRPVGTPPVPCNCRVSASNAWGNAVSVADCLRMSARMTPYNPSRPRIDPGSRLEIRYYELPPAPQPETMFQQVLSLDIAGPSLYVPLPESTTVDSMDMNSDVAEHGSPPTYQSESEEVNIVSEDSFTSSISRSNHYDEEPSPAAPHDSSQDCEERNSYHDETLSSSSNLEANSTISAASSVIDVTDISQNGQAGSTTDRSISSDSECNVQREEQRLGMGYCYLYDMDEYHTPSSPSCECDYHEATTPQYVAEESTESFDNHSLSSIADDVSGTYDYGDDDACSDYNSSSTLVSSVDSDDEQGPAFSPVSVASKDSMEHHVPTAEDIREGAAFVSDEPTSSNNVAKETVRSSTDNEQQSTLDKTIKRRKKYHTYDFPEHYMRYSNNALLGREVCNSYTRNSSESEYPNVSCCTSTTNSGITVCSTGDNSCPNKSQQQYRNNDNLNTIHISDGNLNTIRISDGNLNTIRISDGNLNAVRISDGTTSGCNRNADANKQDEASGKDASRYHQIVGKKRKVAPYCSTPSSCKGTVDEDRRSQTIDDGNNVQEDNVIQDHIACGALVVSSAAAVVVANSKNSSSNIEECSKHVHQNSPKHQNCTTTEKRDAKGKREASGACSVSDENCELQDGSSSDEGNRTDEGTGHSSNKDAIWSSDCEDDDK